MTDPDPRLEEMERRIERLEHVVTQLVEEARSRQTVTGASNSEHAQDRRTITEKMKFDWQDARSQD